MCDKTINDTDNVSTNMTNTIPTNDNNDKYNINKYRF